MSDWEAAAGQVRANIAEDVRLANERAQTASRVRAEVEATVGTAEVDGVRVRTDASGRLLGVEINETAWRRGPRTVAQAVLSVAGRAHRDAARKVAAIAEREFGQDSPFTAKIRAEVEARLVIPEQPQPPASPIIGRPIPAKEARWRTW
jgi:DNA-binding protein YbaB